MEGRARHLPGPARQGLPEHDHADGRQSGSASTNFPRGIEVGVDWTTELLEHMWANGLVREEATPEAEAEWTDHVAQMYGMVLMRKAQSWFTGYNSDVEGHERGTIRYYVYNGGSPRFRRRINEVVVEGYKTFSG